MNCPKIEKFFTLRAKAAKELDDKVKAELKIKDPEAEQVRAVFNEVEGEDEDAVKPAS